MKKLKSILSNVFGIDEGKINDETSPETVEEWDSFNGLMLVSELEEKYGLKFTTEEVTSVKNVGDIKRILRSHGIILEE